MNERDPSKKGPDADPAAGLADAREVRLAAALRANLRRRKAAGRTSPAPPLPPAPDQD